METITGTRKRGRCHDVRRPGAAENLFRPFASGSCKGPGRFFNASNMNKNYFGHSLLGLLAFLSAAGMYSCANIASPSGGPYDETPPRFVRSNPAPNQTNFNGKRIEIEFDELVQLDKPMENVIITPPQIQLPVVRAAGRKIIVELKDTLKPNTTYTIDFTSAISDNNEKNVFENYSFAFSTGNTIDSLEVSGTLLNAENLEPMPGVTIGLHANPDDTAFVKLPFDRTSRTNERGQFVLRNVAAGTYRIYALKDANRDYRFDQPGEEIAFLDTLIVPSFYADIRQDTLWKDSLTIDTIRSVGFTHFLPDDVLLRLFKENFERQYMLRPERNDEIRFSLHFNAPLDTVPLPVPLNFEPEQDDWYVIQPTDADKSAVFWITDSTVWKRDTLELALTYPKSDSLNILQPQTDTLKLVLRNRPKEKKKKKKNDEPDPIVYLNLNTNASGKRELYDTISVTFDEPVLDLSKDVFTLEIQEDTLWNAVDFDFFPDSLNLLVYHIDRDWNYGERYRLRVDSAAVYSVYGKWNKEMESEFSIKTEDEYGHLYINTLGVEGPAFVELLDKNDNPVRKSPVSGGGALFMDLKPDKYYARIVLDANGNGKWDTGNYAAKLQPEEVFYYPGMIEIMQNWKVEQTWDVHATPVERQKPLDITKNKPKEKTIKHRDYKNEGRSSGSSSGSLRMPGL